MNEDVQYVKSCDSCPMESEGGCQHPRASAAMNVINGISDEDTSRVHSRCPLRVRPLNLGVFNPLALTEDEREELYAAI